MASCFAQTPQLGKGEKAMKRRRATRVLEVGRLHVRELVGEQEQTPWGSAS